MKKVYIKFSSVTHAMRAKEILLSNRYKVIMQRNTNNYKDESCGYVLIVIGNAEKIRGILNINQIKYTGFDSK